MQRWSEEGEAFAVETFFKNNDSATVTQRVSRRHFEIGRNGKVPTRQTILIGLHNSGLLHPLSTRSLLVALELYEHLKMCAEMNMHFSVVLSVLRPMELT